jgi:proline iminopeptidase
VATIRVPTLVVHGAEDLVPLDMPRELAQKIPGAQLVIIERAGHFPYIEKPAETFAAINQFLSRVP